jgi:hypothetical protein
MSSKLVIPSSAEPKSLFKELILGTSIGWQGNRSTVSLLFPAPFFEL